MQGLMQGLRLSWHEALPLSPDCPQTLSVLTGCESYHISQSSLADCEWHMHVSLTCHVLLCNGGVLRRLPC